MMKAELDIYLHNFGALIYLVLFPFSLAPSMIDRNHTVITNFPNEDNRLQIVWDPPDNDNGVLLYYSVSIFNQWTEYHVTRNFTPNEIRELDLNDLCKADYIV